MLKLAESTCRWFRNPANSPVEGTVVKIPLFTGVLYIPGSAGFVPSTVLLRTFVAILVLPSIAEKQSSKQSCFLSVEELRVTKVPVLVQNHKMHIMCI